LEVCGHVEPHGFKKALLSHHPCDFCYLCGVEMARKIDGLSPFTAWEGLAREDGSLIDQGLHGRESKDHAVELQIDWTAIHDQKPKENLWDLRMKLNADRYVASKVDTR
jgi:hypothetical protein